MNWSEKSEQIAGAVISRCKLQGDSFTLSRHTLERMLSEAAVMGMEHELKLWLDRPQRNTENGHEKLECQEGQQQ